MSAKTDFSILIQDSLYGPAHRHTQFISQHILLFV
jgi:hypothetical protein